MAIFAALGILVELKIDLILHEIVSEKVGRPQQLTQLQCTLGRGVLNII